MSAAPFAVEAFSVSALALATKDELEARARWIAERARSGTGPTAPLYEER